MNPVRIGQGFDVHPLVAGRRLMLGGLEIPCERGLAGHSDGDVLLHAVASALLGALGEGDLGRHFPSSDPQLEGLAAIGDRVLLFDDCDPTTEVLARWVFERMAERLASGRGVRTPTGATYEIPAGLELERVRVWETSRSWGEYVGIE